MSQPYMVYLMITGVEELNQKLVRLRSAGQSRAMRYAFKEPMRLITKTLKTIAPKKSGVLSRSIAWRMLNTWDARKGRNVSKGPGGEEVVFFAKSGPDVARKKPPRNKYQQVTGSAKFRAPHAHLVSLGTVSRHREIPVGFTGKYGSGKHGIRGKYWRVELWNWLALSHPGWAKSKGKSANSMATQNRDTGTAIADNYVDMAEKALAPRVSTMIEKRFEQAIEAEWKKQNP